MVESRNSNPNQGVSRCEKHCSSLPVFSCSWQRCQPLRLAMDPIHRHALHVALFLDKLNTPQNRGHAECPLLCGKPYRSKIERLESRNLHFPSAQLLTPAAQGSST